MTLRAAPSMGLYADAGAMLDEQRGGVGSNVGRRAVTPDSRPLGRFQQLRLPQSDHSSDGTRQLGRETLTYPLHQRVRRQAPGCGAAFVALADEKGNIQPGTARRLLFSGQPGTSIPAGAPFLSDPVDLPVKTLSALSISLYLPEDTGQCTCHQTGVQKLFVSDSGDFTDKPFTPAQTLEIRAFISGVDVQPAKVAKAVVVLGDSISDGVGATVDANHRWPDLLANRLDAKQHLGCGQHGLSGNRVLGDGAGQSALAGSTVMCWPLRGPGW